MRFWIALGLTSIGFWSYAQQLTLLPQPDDVFECTPVAISRNNQVIIGSCRGRFTSFGIYWRDGQWYQLPDFPRAVSADGSRIAIGGGYWENGNWVRIYPQNLNRAVAPASMTPDGRVIIGRIQGNGGVLMFRWEEGVGLELHRQLDQPRWVRPDGQRIYAARYIGTGENLWSAVYADDLCSYETLVEYGAPFGDLVAVSDDERYLLLRESAGGWLWDRAENVAYFMEVPPGAMRTFPQAMAQDGTTYGSMNLALTRAHAFRWTKNEGTRDLNELYACVLPDGWFFLTVNAVSHDGRYVLGILQRQSDSARRTFVLDTAPALQGDVNRDGCVDDADLLTVLFNFGATGSGLNADVNCDGVVDDADLLIVLFNFGAGCG